MSIIKNILYKKTYINDRKIKALCFFFDGKFDNEFAKATNIEMYGNEDLSVYKWDKNLKNDNIILLDKAELEKLSYDLIIFNSLITFEKHILSLPRHLHIPGIIFQHENTGMTEFHLRQKLNQARLKLIDNIPYFVEKKETYKDIDVLVSGMFQKEDYHIIEKVREKIPNIIVIGNNPGLPYSIPMSDYESYKEIFYRTKIYLNLTTQKCVNYEALWSLAGGAEVIGFKVPGLEKIQKYVTNCNTIESIISCCKNQLSAYKTNPKKQEDVCKEFNVENIKGFENYFRENYCQKVFKYE